MLFRSIADRSEIDRLVSLGVRPEPLTHWVTSALVSGESRLDWCRMALSDDDKLLAAHIFDSFSLDGEHIV